jgi:hypothetical protein
MFSVAIQPQLEEHFQGALGGGGFYKHISGNSMTFIIRIFNMTPQPWQGRPRILYGHWQTEIDENDLVLNATI